MSDDPAHKAMLYFLEVLMNSNGPLTISQLAGRFGSRTFSADMRQSAGSNEIGLRKFLLKYPSLFTVRGNMVALCDGKSPPMPASSAAGDDSGGGYGILERSPLPDVSAELAAVGYFQQRLVKKEERWVLIRSLAGHLSQAEAIIRDTVGPQLDFRRWLLRHPHIFDVQGELVGLKDGVAAIATPAIPVPRREEVTAVIMRPPKTPPPSRRVPKSPAAIRRSHSFGDKQRLSELEAGVGGSTPQLNRKDAPITMTANEYRAVTFLKDTIEKKGSGIRLHSLASYFSTAHEAVRTTIGWLRAEQEDFVRRFNTVFTLDDDLVYVVKNAKLNVIITGSKPSGGPVRTLNGRKGRIFHVAKLWGIIDLGKHEHVFFDKSIMRRPIDDLSKEYKANEMLYFHAVLAPKTSRAKWRATHVWRDGENQPTGSQMDLSSLDRPQLSPAASIEDEINRFLPQDSKYPDSDTDTKYADADISSSGNVPVYISSSSNYKLGTAPLSIKMMSEQVQVTEPAIPVTTVMTNGISSLSQSSPNSFGGKKCAEVGCQTISTGDIIATHLYYED